MRGRRTGLGRFVGVWGRGPVLGLALQTALWGIPRWGVTAQAAAVTLADLTGDEHGDYIGTNSAPTGSPSTALVMSASSSSTTSGAPEPEKAAPRFHVDPFSGSGGFSVPLFSPPARGGMKPALALSYAPRRGNGPFGMGWGIEFGHIERSTKHGTPHFDDTDTFLCYLGGTVFELVSLGGGEYRSRREGAFMRFFFDGTTWKVQDRQGRTYFFGLAELLEDESRGPYDDGYRWELSEVRDVHGNYYFIRHFREGDFEILYTGEPGTDRDALDAGTQKFWARVTAELEPDPREDRIVSARSGRELFQTRRISAVQVETNGVPVRRYEFSYHDSPRTHRSLLDRIQETDGTGAHHRPPLTFAYQDGEPPGYTLHEVVAAPSAGDNLWNARFSGDFDRGHDNFGPIPGFDTVMGPTMTQSSGTWDRGWWETSPGGSLRFSSEQDSANQFWTYLYVTSPQTLHVPIDDGEGVVGVWVNGDYEHNVWQDWPLKTGYNIVEITAYHQHQSFTADLNLDVADHVDLMNSSQVLIPQLSGDFNGDGFTDVGTYFPSSGQVKVALSSGEGFLPKTVWIEGFAPNKKVLVGDFDGDGRSDLCAFDKDTGDWRVALSDGTRFTDEGVWLSAFGAGEEPLVGDFDGDGRTDVLRYYPNDQIPENYAQIALNTGGAFSPDAGGEFDLSKAGFTPFIMDLNGDGLADGGSYQQPEGHWKFITNVGNLHFGSKAQFNVWSFAAGKPAVVADFNGDGRTDVGHIDTDTGEIHYRLASGDAFREEDLVLPVTFDLPAAETHIQTGDYNGDGLTDFLAYTNGGSYQIAYSSGGVPDLLTQADNHIGGVTEIAYAPSTIYDNTYLPFVLQVVERVTTRDSRGSSHTVRYSYEGGLWDAGERELRGFAVVKTIDPEGRTTETRFLQDDTYLQGRIAEQAVYDVDHNLYAKTVNTWDLETIEAGTTPPVKFVHLVRRDNFVYDGDADGRRTAEEYTYGEDPQWGDVTRTLQLGEVDLDTGEDIPGDSRSEEIQYVHNASPDVRLLGLPKIIESRAGDGTLMRRTTFYYDGHSDPAEPPTRGLLTRRVEWAGDGAAHPDPETTYAYDAYGNLIATTDPLGNTSTVTYDAGHHLFSLITENALGHTVTRTYYGVDGEPLADPDGLSGLWGQRRSETDPNGASTRWGYDVFGRTTIVVGPQDTVDLPTVTMEYVDEADHTRVRTHRRVTPGRPEEIVTVDFYDGLGRLIQKTSPSGVAGRVVVAGRTEYDARGLPRKSYLPYFHDGTLDDLPPIDPNRPAVTSEYDPQGRIVKTTRPDGAYATLEYDDWTLTAIDANGHKTVSRFDAYGRLIRKEEYLGADGRSPFYPAEPYTLYAQVAYTYDSEGRLIRTRDPRGNEIRITYDALGRKTAMDDPDLGHWEYGYDAVGDLVWQKDALGRRIDFTYDALHRLVRKTDGGDLAVDYTYDDPAFANTRGRLTRSDYNVDESTQFYYDILGREVRTEKTIGGEVYTVQRSYNGLNALTGVLYPTGYLARYTYDDAGRLDGVSLVVP